MLSQFILFFNWSRSSCQLGYEDAFIFYTLRVHCSFILNGSQPLTYFKIQAHLLRWQAKWTKTVERFNIRKSINWERTCHDRCTLTTNLRSADGSDALNEDWLMLYASDINNDLLIDTSPRTRNMFISRLDKSRILLDLVKIFLNNGSLWHIFWQPRVRSSKNSYLKRGAWGWAHPSAGFQMSFSRLLAQSVKTVLCYYCDLGHTRS